MKTGRAGEVSDKRFKERVKTEKGRKKVWGRPRHNPLEKK